MISNRSKSGPRMKVFATLLAALLLAGFGTLHAQDETLGQETYQATCSACHGPAGAGIPSVFPPLSAHAAELASLEGGSAYLIRAILFGLQGPIEIAGTSYSSVMPAQAQALSDEQVAAVVNFIVMQWPSEEASGDFTAVTADAVAELRPEALTGEQVHALRAELLDQ